MLTADLRRRLLWINLAAAAMLGACAGMGGLGGLAGPPRITLDADEIAQLLDRQFPQDRRLLEVLDVTLRSPRVRLLAERNRLAAVLDLGVSERIFGTRWNGRLEFDSALRWELRDRSLRLAQARVTDLQVTSAGSEVRTPAERLGAALAERVLEDLVLYTLPAERAEALRARGFAPQAVAVTARGVEITFSAIPR